MEVNTKSGISLGTFNDWNRDVPLDVRRRQFKTMAKVFGFESIQAFGLHIEKMKSEKRTQLLGVFYRHRREFLGKLGMDQVDEEL